MVDTTLLGFGWPFETAVDIECLAQSGVFEDTLTSNSYCPIAEALYLSFAEDNDAQMGDGIRR